LQVPGLDGRVVHVDTGGRSAGGRIDAADRDIRILVVVVAAVAHAVAEKSDAGTEPGDVIDGAQALLVELLLAESSDAHRHVLEPLLASLRRDDDLLERAAGGGRRGVGGGGRCNGAQYARERRNKRQETQLRNIR